MPRTQLTGICVGILASGSLWAQPRETIRVHLASEGSESGTFQGENGAQRGLDYSFVISVDLTGRFSSSYGDILEYELTEKIGDLEFSGSTWEEIDGTPQTLDFDHGQRLDIRSAGGRLEYSRSLRRVVLVAFSTERPQGAEGISYIRHLAYNSPAVTYVFATARTDWAIHPGYRSCGGAAYLDLFGAPPEYDWIAGSPFAYGRHLAGYPVGSGFGYNAFYRRWMLYRNGGFLSVAFDLPEVPPAARLVLRHLTSAHAECPNGGYSPVSISVNGQWIEQDYDPASRYGGRFWFVVDSWPVEDFLYPGANTVEIFLGDDACTTHWIEYIGIDYPEEECVSCAAPCGGGDPLSPGCTEFRRGDSNDDLSVDISDAISILLYLFAGTVSPRCEKAADWNDDGTLNVSDAVGCLRYLFRSGPAARAPWGACSWDPTEDSLGCEASAGC